MREWGQGGGVRSTGVEVLTDGSSSLRWGSQGKILFVDQGSNDGAPDTQGKAWIPSVRVVAVKRDGALRVGCGI